MIMNLLADVADAPKQFSLSDLKEILGWVTTFVVALVSAVLVKTTRTASKAEGKAEGKAEAMTVGPQPFMVELKEAFVTRREFDRLEATVESSATKVEASVDKLATITAKQNENLSKRLVSQGDRLRKEMGEIAGGAYQGRQRLHATQNEHTARIAALEARDDMASGLGKLGEAIVTAIKESNTNPS